ncbi:hypothetical protein QE152_g27225 [Popillia japonica]|uniref:Uncharacterized protein n=1 Tax=Popillia japonica TaxID=7064 RepID=A0AAW1JVS0_POPJA
MPRARANTFPKDGMDDAGRKSTKRLREEEESDHLQELRKQFDRLAKTVNELVAITDASSKTKTEIKNNVKKLKRQLTDIHKPEDIKKDFDEKKVLVANKIRMVIEENSTFNKLAEILDEKWPQESYKITETAATDNSAKIDHYGDYAILMDPKKSENKLVDSLTLKYAGLAELMEKNEGQADFLIQTLNTRTRANTHVEKSSAVHLLPLSIDATGVNDMEAVYEKIVQLKENISMHPTENISLVISEGLKLSYVKKICEYVFAKQKVKIKLLTQTPRSDPKQRRSRIPRYMKCYSNMGKCTTGKSNICAVVYLAI